MVTFGGNALAPRSDFYITHLAITALAGVVVVLERYVTLRRQMRLAYSGSILVGDPSIETVRDRKEFDVAKAGLFQGVQLALSQQT